MFLLPYSLYKYFLKNSFIYKLLIGCIIFVFLNNSSPASGSFWLQLTIFIFCFMIFLSHYGKLITYHLQKTFHLQDQQSALIYLHSSLIFFCLILFKPFLIYHYLFKYLIFSLTLILFLYFISQKIKRKFKIQTYFVYSIFIKTYLILFMLPLIIVIGIFSLL